MVRQTAYMDFSLPIATDWNVCTFAKQWPETGDITEISANLLASTADELTAVGGFYATLNDGRVLPLMTPDLFGVYSALQWSGNLHAKDIKNIVLYAVGGATTDNVRLRVTWGGTGTTHSGQQPKKQRLYSVVGTGATAGGNGVTVPLTVPFGRKWEIISATVALDEVAKVVYAAIQNSGLAFLAYLVYIASSGSGTIYQFPQGRDVTLTNTLVRAQIRSGERVAYVTTTATNAKTLSYTITYIERPDDCKTSSPT